MAVIICKKYKLNRQDQGPKVAYHRQPKLAEKWVSVVLELKILKVITTSFKIMKSTLWESRKCFKVSILEVRVTWIYLDLSQIKPNPKLDFNQEIEQIQMMFTKQFSSLFKIY